MNRHSTDGGVVDPIEHPYQWKQFKYVGLIE